MDFDNNATDGAEDLEVTPATETEAGSTDETEEVKPVNPWETPPAADAGIPAVADEDDLDGEEVTPGEEKVGEETDDEEDEEEL